jgi:hypothetical protein
MKMCSLANCQNYLLTNQQSDLEAQILLLQFEPSLLIRVEDLEFQTQLGFHIRSLTIQTTTIVMLRRVGPHSRRKESQES